ncbi:MAG: hypothetical protein PUB19_03535 [Lachnospiraceae bacterium]|nr:hypothetical protein [Lachnospiraceae bacterium]
MFTIRKKLMGTFAAIAVLVMTLPMQLQAAGTTTIRVSDSGPTVGDGVSVNVIASESDSVSVKYNPEVLQLTGSSVEYTTEGNTITFQGADATFQFQAVESGKSSIIVSGTNVTGSSTSIQVADGSANATESTQTANDTTNTAEGQFTVDGTDYVVSERFADEEIPAGFEKTRVTIDGYGYKALTNGDLTLIYLKPASDVSSKGVFYLYNADSNEVSSFAMLGEGEHYILLTTPEKLLFDGMEQTEIKVSDRNVTVYSFGGGQEFYFAYGTNPQGESGWYQYDITDGSLQRVNQQLLGAVSTGDEATQAIEDKDAYYDKWSKQRYLLAGLLFVIVVLLVLVVNLFLSRKRDHDDDWEEEYDEDEDTQIPSPSTETIVPEATVDEADTDMMQDEKEQIVYKDIKGTEAFRSSKETRHKSNAEDQIDILDLNDL